jgi:hypothetical protein
MHILNNELPYGYEDGTYAATVFASGGVPYSSGGNYKWCRQESASITGLTFSPSTLNSDCLGLSEGSWGQADDLDISGTPTTNGSFSITFFARDDNDQSGSDDNIAQMTVVLTVNMAETTPCTDYRVWNDLGYERDFLREGDCDGISSGSEVTSESRFLSSGEDLKRYNSSTCGWSLESTLTFAEAQTADADGDCCLYFNETDRTCP